MSVPLNVPREAWLEQQLHEARERIIELERELSQKTAAELPPITGTVDSTEPSDTMAKK